MAFDAGMMSCVLHEIRKTSLGARIEKVYQPESCTVILQIRSASGGKKLLINAGPANPRIGFTEVAPDNPLSPPMFCMLLRKHLSGARLSEVEQLGFDRVARLKLETYDEMGYPCERYLIAEIMGRFSNLIFTDGEEKILASLHTTDLTGSSGRTILPGVRYLPPAQDRINPVELQKKDEVVSMLSAARGIADTACEKWLMTSFSGFSPMLAREIVYLSSGRTDTLLSELNPDRFADSFLAVISKIRNRDFDPCIFIDGDKPKDYSFLPMTHLGDYRVRHMESPGLLLDEYYRIKDRDERIKQRASDILKLLNNSRSRIVKKMEIQRQELGDCQKGPEYKRNGELILANLGRVPKGSSKVELIDYSTYSEEGDYKVVQLSLDPRLSPSDNAQKYFKKYNKCKKAETELTRQIRLGEEELDYLETVLASLSQAETFADLNEIREELSSSGYGRRMHQPKGNGKKSKDTVPQILKLKTTSGKTVLCGKNNTQNDYITFRLARKDDYWFHVKNAPGSHVVLVCDGKEPLDRDFTEAAEIAAIHSSVRQGDNIEVDYTQVKNVKKPSGSRPGFVIYHTNYSATVSPAKNSSFQKDFGRE